MGLIKGEAIKSIDLSNDSVQITSKSTMQKKESHLRSILKGITWRVVATTTIIIIAWLTTGNIELALKIGLWEFFIKLFLYYLHERAWQLVPRGGVRKFFKLKSKNG